MHAAVRIGSRGSALALKQAEIVQQKLLAKNPTLHTEIVVIQTEGDENQVVSLSQLGGKGVFIKELEQALLENRIDLAVHSFKDITSTMPDSLQLVAVLQPESICDAMVLRSGVTSAQLQSGGVIGTGSLRRKLFLNKLFPHCVIKDIRGNVDTRLRKLEAGDYDAIVLSEAGLIRLELTDLPIVRFDPTAFLPAPGQGVIAIQCRAQDSATETLAKSINHPDQWRISQVEWALLKAVGFDCRVPLGTHARLEDGEVVMDVACRHHRLSGLTDVADFAKLREFL